MCPSHVTHWYSPTIHFFFFQAEDGIRDFHVTGVQTCALPISAQNVAGPSWFAAFPISAAGPAAGTGSSWRQIARVVPTAGQATVDFQNVPADINDLRLHFDVVPTANANSLALTFFDNVGTIDNTATHYQYNVVNASSGMTSGGAPAIQNSVTTTVTNAILLDYGVATRRVQNSSGIRGRIT